MAKFANLEEAQKAHDALEAKAQELTGGIERLNAENASRRKAAETLEAELKTLRESSRTEAEKAAEGRLGEKHKAELAALTQQNATEIRGRDLRLAAMQKGVVKNADRVIKLIDPATPPEKFGEAFDALLKEIPGLADKPAVSAPDNSPGGKGGGPTDLAERLKGEKAEVPLDDLLKA